ncbi:hypothetical protein K466DRAFT_149263 [Polyporus arcularius HHB13444]|uniref:Uncharacterized protein n=1 Tax=Polyporus arcularius HHB13444 TaxID=1314778 RepID=A0A5C3PB17_9APHY|nr:hypothetical protein K466DRAFT_149263 [Polyporus arcularius HHB13444]
MIDAAAYLLADGGHFEELQAGAPHVAVFHMVPRHGDPDLGRSWALRSFDIRPIDYWTKQYPGIKPSMPSTLDGHKAVAEAYRTKYGSRYCATLITAYHILDNVYDFGHRLVLTPSDPGLLTEQPVPDALRDLINLCFFAINHDIVLPTPSLEDKIFITSASEPVSNHRTKTRKYQRVQRTLDTVYGRLIKAGYPPKSTLSTTQMMNLLESLYCPI